jgi:5-methylcytosine-specific restriction protein A
MPRNYVVTVYNRETGEVEQGRTESSRRTSHSRWRRLRLRVLDRDDHLCQIRGPKCTRVASQVDHIIPAEYGGEDSEENAQSVCRSCHNAKTTAQHSPLPNTRSRKRSRPIHPSEAANRCL